MVASREIKTEAKDAVLQRRGAENAEKDWRRKDHIEKKRRGPPEGVPYESPSSAIRAYRITRS
jgi:hypothetical protein